MNRKFVAALCITIVGSGFAWFQLARRWQSTVTPATISSLYPGTWMIADASISPSSTIAFKVPGLRPGDVVEHNGRTNGVEVAFSDGAGVVTAPLSTGENTFDIRRPGVRREQFKVENFASTEDDTLSLVDPSLVTTISNTTLEIGKSTNSKVEDWTSSSAGTIRLPNSLSPSETPSVSREEEFNLKFSRWMASRRGVPSRELTFAGTQDIINSMERHASRHYCIGIAKVATEIGRAYGLPIRSVCLAPHSESVKVSGHWAYEVYDRRRSIWVLRDFHLGFLEVRDGDDEPLNASEMHGIMSESSLPTDNLIFSVYDPKSGRIVERRWAELPSSTRSLIHCYYGTDADLVFRHPTPAWLPQSNITNRAINRLFDFDDAKVLNRTNEMISVVSLRSVKHFVAAICTVSMATLAFATVPGYVRARVRTRRTNRLPEASVTPLSQAA